MRALSIKQPWAWAILNYEKTVENRTWPTRFTGSFLIHTGKTFDHEGYRWLINLRDLKHEYCTKKYVKALAEIPARDDFKMGGIVGKARIVDCVDSHKSLFFVGPWGFVLEDIEPLPFYPCKGKLGFFNVEYQEVEPCL
jgi:hypothetical protein